MDNMVMASAMIVNKHLIYRNNKPKEEIQKMEEYGQESFVYNILRALKDINIVILPKNDLVWLKLVVEIEFIGGVIK